MPIAYTEVLKKAVSQRCAEMTQRCAKPPISEFLIQLLPDAYRSEAKVTLERECLLPILKFSKELYRKDAQR